MTAGHTRFKLLVTGFSSFPGMPKNPTEHFVRRLQHTNPRFSNAEVTYSVLPVSWRRTSENLDRLFEAVNPDAVVHFGVAGKAQALRIETRARNRTTRRVPDADGQFPLHRELARSDPRFRRVTLSPRRLCERARASGCRTQLSSDAGSYLCNAVLWHSLALGMPAVFIHWPMPQTRRPRLARRNQRRTAPSAEQLDKASRAILSYVVRWGVPRPQHQDSSAGL